MSISRAKGLNPAGFIRFINTDAVNFQKIISRMITSVSLVPSKRVAFK